MAAVVPSKSFRSRQMIYDRRIIGVNSLAIIIGREKGSHLDLDGLQPIPA
jgi:hypothetical protein